MVANQRNNMIPSAFRCYEQDARMSCDELTVRTRNSLHKILFGVFSLMAAMWLRIRDEAGAPLAAVPQAFDHFR